MTDDELERTLFALPLEEPPPDLRRRILAATVERPRLSFRAWEIWTVGTLLAFTVWLAGSVGASVPDFGGTIARAMDLGLDRFAQTLSPAALMWMAFGVSFVIWVSVLSLPASRRTLPEHR